MRPPAEALLMPYRGKDVPHAVIEVNQRCNISCTACYKDKSTYTKPLAQIAREIEVAAASRRLGVLTLAGGEPTLHPQLPEIIELVARRGIAPQMLSNGLALTDDRLREYRARGLGRIYLHIDSLQRRPDARNVASEADLDALRNEIASRVVRHGIRCALTLTLYRNRNLKDLRSVVEFVIASRFFDRLFVTCCTDFAAIGERLREVGRLPAEAPAFDDGLSGEVVSNEEVARALEDGLGLQPYAYIASSRRRAERRWLFYYSYAIHTPEGAVAPLHFAPTFRRVVRVANAISRALRGTYPFGEPLSRAGSIGLCLAYAATSLRPRTIIRTLRFLANLRRPGAEIAQKSLIFQQGPNVTESGRLEICRDCPDATVRNGRLVPVCLADLVSPLAEEPVAVGSSPESPAGVQAAVRR